jgi:hypothetical protein
METAVEEGEEGESLLVDFVSFSALRGPEARRAKSGKQSEQSFIIMYREFQFRRLSWIRLIIVGNVAAR